MKKCGFLLIEALIYMLISSIFLILLFQFISNIYSKCRTTCFSNSSYAYISGAVDLISRDIQMGSSNPELWKKITNNSLIFSLNKVNKIIDIGWYIEKNNLYRIEGDYNIIDNKWVNGIKSLGCPNIVGFQIKINCPTNFAASFQSKIIALVSVTLITKINGKIIKIQKSIYPRSGLVIYE